MDAKEKAKAIYARMTSFANYEYMNGIERDWFLKCIEEGIKSFAEHQNNLPSDEEIRQVAADECQQDWNDLRFKDVYYNGFMDCAKWLKSRINQSQLPNDKEKEKSVRKVNPPDGQTSHVSKGLRMETKRPYQPPQ